MVYLKSGIYQICQHLLETTKYLDEKSSERFVELEEYRVSRCIRMCIVTQGDNFEIQNSKTQDFLRLVNSFYTLNRFVYLYICIFSERQLDTTIFDERAKSTSKISRKVYGRVFPKTFDFRIVPMSVLRYRRYLWVSWVTKIATSFRSSKLRTKQRVVTTSMSIRPIGGQLGIPTLRLDCSKQMSRNRCV